MGNGDMTAIFERRTMTSFTPDRVLLKVLRVHESLVIVILGIGAEENQMLIEVIFRKRLTSLTSLSKLKV